MRLQQSRLAIGALVFVAGVHPAIAEPSVAGTVCVPVLDEAGVTATDLAKAMATAGRVFAAIGVHLAPDGEVGCSRFVVVRVLPPGSAALARASRRALGFASVGGDTAYVVHERIKSYAAARRHEFSAALGLVIAHELGHLLIGRAAHTNVGLMRASWTDSDFRRAVAGGSGFTPEDARLIRARLIARK